MTQPMANVSTTVWFPLCYFSYAPQSVEKQKPLVQMAEVHSDARVASLMSPLYCFPQDIYENICEVLRLGRPFHLLSSRPL